MVIFSSPELPAALPAPAVPPQAVRVSIDAAATASRDFLNTTSSRKRSYMQAGEF
jgi:hypothetical protein